MTADLFTKLREEIRHALHMRDSVTDEELKELIEDSVLYSSKQQYLTADEKHELIHRIFNSFRGLDVLQPLIDDKSITEIMINDFNEIFIEREGRVTLHPAQFESRAKLEDIIQMIVGKVNRVVNESSPIVDARLTDGSRVNVVLPPVALKGPTMTIRKFPENPMTMEDLIARGALPEDTAVFLQKLVQARFNLFIGGGTGSGKTTFLNALSQYIPEDERIITIEDSAELQIRTVPNLVGMEVKNANSEGKGAITMRDLIRSSLRMRPNRIVVGEVRGAEALEMLQAMNTGHDGSLSTGHANSSQDMLSRLETMVLSGVQLPVEVIRKQIASALDILIHLSRLRDKSRRVVEINEVLDVENGEIQLNPLFTFVEEGETEDGKVIGGLQPTGNALQNMWKLRMAGISI